ncbi:heterokaryon incompatibility, partial [Lojkania enalia]
YEALSYTWGGQGLTEPIFCNGKSLLITKNLHSALLKLRLRQESRLLWVDAICINQLDLNEKNKQIPLMMDIYKLAARVIVWLGSEADDSSLALTSMQFLDTTLLRVYESQSAVFGRPWFRRSWIRQEIIMAKDIVV